jgi:hypothetical protein
MGEVWWGDSAVRKTLNETIQGFHNTINAEDD